MTDHHDHGHGHGHGNARSRMGDDLPDDLSAVWTQAFWDDRYASIERVWSGNPNASLVAEVESLPPGDALEVGCGEGGDAVWLASLGWRVLATDISPVVLERAAAHTPPELADRIVWQQADALDWQPEPDSVDLAHGAFVHIPADRLPDFVARIARAVRVGGRIVLLGHHHDDHALGIRNARLSELLDTQDRFAAALPSGWSVVRAAAPTREVDWQGERLTVTDAVLHAIRDE